MSDNVKKVGYLWGAGHYAEIVYMAIEKSSCVIKGIVDSSKEKQGKMWKEGMVIQTPDILLEEDYDLVFLTPGSYEQVKIQCINMGIPEEKIVVFWQDGEAKPFRNRNEVIIELDRAVVKYRNRLENAPYEWGIKKIPIVKSSSELVKRIIAEKQSLARYGDGEFEIMMRRERPWFQGVDETLSERLRTIIRSCEDNVIIAIADNFGSLEKYKEESADVIRDYMVQSREDINQLIDFDKCYFNAYVSRPYIMYRDKGHAGKIFALFREVWKERKVLLVEGKNARISVGNDLMDGAESIRRIECPERNAWNKYELILKSVVANADEDDLICISLGPTATVLAYDLAALGFQALDIGQLDNEYEWYIRNSDKRVAISGKMVAEVGRDVYAGDIEDISWQRYQEQIIDVVEG